MVPIFRGCSAAAGGGRPAQSVGGGSNVQVGRLCRRGHGPRRGLCPALPVAAGSRGGVVVVITEDARDSAAVRRTPLGSGGGGARGGVLGRGCASHGVAENGNAEMCFLLNRGSQWSKFTLMEHFTPLEPQNLLIHELCAAQKCRF